MKLVLGDYMKIDIWCPGVENEHFCSAWRDSPPSPPPFQSTGFLPNARFGGKGRTVHTWWRQQAT